MHFSNQPSRPSSEIEIELEAATKQRSDLLAKRDELEALLYEIKMHVAPTQQLCNRLRGELEQSRAYEKDMKRTKVVWGAQGRGDCYEAVVVSRSEKRIFIRRPGSDCKSAYYPNGQPVSSYGRFIDVEATFKGETMK